MESNYFENRLIKKDIRKIKREYLDNIFSTKLKSSMTIIIMKYLDIKDLYEFAKTSIYIFNTFIDYENYVLYKSLQEKERKNICKIFLKEDKQGFGYFIKIQKINLKALFINMPLTEEEKKNKIKILKENKEKEIDLDNKTIYINYDNGISIIEISENKDNIHDFFDYDIDTSNLNINETLCVFNTNTKVDDNIIYGEFKSKENAKNIFYYFAQNNNEKDIINKYSPIINISNNKLIGYHEQYKMNDNYNEGIFLKGYINLFIRENLINKTKDKFNNKGIYKRILRELDEYDKNKDGNYTLTPREDFSILDAIIIGPEDTPYHGGKFKLEINYGKDYPFRPPKITFLTKIYHPNFRGDGKEVCRCALEELGTNWAPCLNVPKLLDMIFSLLKNPVPKTDIKCNNSNNECAVMMVQNPEKYKEIALDWTKKYAI